MNRAQFPRHEARESKVVVWAVLACLLAIGIVSFAYLSAQSAKMAQEQEKREAAQAEKMRQQKAESDRQFAESQAKREAEQVKQTMISTITRWGDDAAPKSKAGLSVEWDWFPEVSGVEAGNGVTIWRYTAYYRATILGTRVRRAVKILYRCQGYDPNTCSQTSLEDLAAS